MSSAARILAPRGEDSRLTYIALTTGGADPHAPLRWVLALHGLGDRPEAFAGLFRSFTTPAHVYLVRAPIASGRGFDWFGARVDGPADALAEAVSRSSDQLADLATELAGDPSNVGRPIVTGFSQGGYLSFALAAQHPEVIAAALPIAGALPQVLWPSRTARELPRVIAFHGAADRRVPIASTRELTSAFTRAGYAVKWFEYPEVQHEIAAGLFADWSRALGEQLTQTR